MTPDTPLQSDDEDEKDPEDAQNDLIDEEFELEPEQDFQAPFIDEEEEDELAGDDLDMDDDRPGEYDENVPFESDENEEEPFYQVVENHNANVEQMAAMLDDQSPVEDEGVYHQDEIEHQQEQVVEVASALYVFL